MSALAVAELVGEPLDGLLLDIHRRTKQGMSKREIIRCLKRYVAREIYRQIQSASASAAQPSAT